MTAEEHELRERVAKVEQKVDDLSDDVRAMAPLAGQQALLDANLSHLDEGLAAVRAGLDGLKEHLTSRAEQQQKDRIADRRWLIGTVLAAASIIIAALSVLADKF